MIPVPDAHPHSGMLTLREAGLERHVTEPTSIIALDWGTTSLRAYRVGSSGEVLQKRIVTAGILKLPEGGFLQALATVASDWATAHPGATLIASGMVGSRQGLQEVPYARAPATLASLAAGCAAVPVSPEHTLHLIPGVSLDDERGRADVMRGEETQVLGAVPEQGRHLVVLPGTHCKWVTVADAAITGFSTHLTGELFELLATHSILATTMDATADDEPAFVAGVERGLAEPAALLRELFTARASTLLGRMESGAMRAHVSGLLLGSELADACRLHADALSAAGGVLLLGDAALVQTYARAMAVAGISAVPGDPDAAPRGALRVASAADLVPQPDI
ncbi:MAG: 2-dehydro-3-deoxygalactonokinase [Pseudomonadota bacterium]